MHSRGLHVSQMSEECDSLVMLEEHRNSLAETLDRCTDGILPFDVRRTELEKSLVGQCDCLSNHGDLLIGKSWVLFNIARHLKAPDDRLQTTAELSVQAQKALFAPVRHQYAPITIHSIENRRARSFI